MVSVRYCVSQRLTAVTHFGITFKSTMLRWPFLKKKIEKSAGTILIMVSKVTVCLLLPPFTVFAPIRNMPS
jgi:hypothetical protein